MTEREQIEVHLWAAIDLMAATLVQPDERTWRHLLVYLPAELRTDGEATQVKEDR